MGATPEHPHIDQHDAEPDSSAARLRDYNTGMAGDNLQPQGHITVGDLFRTDLLSFDTGTRLR